MQTGKRSGPRIEPCGTPEGTGAGDDSVSSTFTLKDLSVRNELIHCRSSTQSRFQVRPPNRRSAMDTKQG